MAPANDRCVEIAFVERVGDVVREDLQHDRSRVSRRALAPHAITVNDVAPVTRATSVLDGGLTRYTKGL